MRVEIFGNQKGSMRTLFFAGEFDMRFKTQISGRLIAAARALTGIGQAEFAEAAGLPLEALCLMEAGWQRVAPFRAGC